MNPSESRSRRDLLRGVAAGALLGRAARGAATPDRPNILYLHSHDTGRYIQPFGHEIPTPHLQKLADEGILFRHAFDAAPTCSPSRASLLTGECPHNNGMLGLAHRGFSLYDYNRHIIHRLKPLGYRTTLIGVQHIAKDPSVIGYDEVVRTPGNHAAVVAPAAVKFLNSAPKEPFFLTVGFQETHRQYREPGSAEDKRYTLPPAPILDTPETRYDAACFKATARELDRGMGEVLDALESHGLANNTLVICTTDHGIAFPEMKCNLTVHGTGVFLIMRGPGGFGGGKICDAMVSHLDLYPTICDLVKVAHPAWLQGKSLMPLIRGEATELHDELFAEVNYHAAYEPKRAVRTRRWNYIKRFGDRTHPVLPNCDDGPSKTVWLNHGWKERADPEERLYDTFFDPDERYNVAHDPAYATALNEMRGRLSAWMKRTDDPLLRGPVKAPAGAVVNDPDGISPHERTRPA